MTTPVWQTTAGFLGTLTERTTVSIPLVATGASSYSVISGSLPVGLYLNTSTGVLLGTPVSVSTDFNSTAVIRAKNADGVSDRTFSFTVTGPSNPLWVTPGGLLPVGMDGEQYTINKEYVDFTFRAETDVLQTGNTLKYFIADNEGQLPPGLSLDTTGRITGFVDDNLKIEKSATIGGGYDTEFYDKFPYEHSVINQSLVDTGAYIGSYDITYIALESPCRIILTTGHDLKNSDQVYIDSVVGTTILNGNTYYVKIITPTSFELYSNYALTDPVDAVLYNEYVGNGKVFWGKTEQLRPEVINKIYQFYVTVTDGIASSRRKFSIEVVDPDSLRVDTTYISVDEDIFDASAGYLLAPIWQSKYGAKLPRVQNLGTVRAGKPQVLSIYDYDPYPLAGPTVFDWNTVGVNPDIKLYVDSRINAANLPTKNLKGDIAIYYKSAELTPVKGMKIQFNEYIPNTDATIYTVTGVIKLNETTGILNIDQPLSQQIPDSKIFYAGTISQRPPGISLDPMSGTLSGQLGYQPAYAAGYRFTVKVVKIDQETGDDTLYNATGSNDCRIVGKVYSVTNNTYPDDIPVLNNPYSGSIGDIVLVGITPPVNAEFLLPLMDGTVRAYVYTGTGWTYLGDTVASNQIYLLNVLGDIPSTIEFISTSSLGVLTPGEISELAVKAVNTNTNYSIQYEIISGQLPPGLTFNQDGTIQGRVINSGQTYFDFGLTTATFVGNIVNNILTVNTVTSGEIILHQSIANDNITSPTYLVKGAGNTWTVSDLTTTATNTVTNTSTYIWGLTFPTLVPTPINVDTSTFVASTLSPTAYANNILVVDGSATTVDKNWYFTVRASDVYRLSSVEKECYITVYQDTLTEYTRIYVKPFLTKEKRMAYKDFITDPIIFDPVLIYRPNDPEFGIQQNIKMLLETGIEKATLDDYAGAMQEFFYRKSFYFGEVKSIPAQDSNGNNIYDIVYVEIIDNQMNGTTSPSYAVSVNNMQLALESIQLDSTTVIGVNSRLQPKYMTTLQSDTGVAIGFVKAVPLCYTIPGGALKILSRINNAISTGAFDFKQYHFDTDRIVVETVKDTEQTGWILNPTDRR